ncbi:hypothetical protein CspHIS471_0609450 [Cutaneotrichosporon sp. HIS471]|nr:hypothetical protein CspHIS471_0609450 [Cutaneotrichosporon sp. HIS471]
MSADDSFFNPRGNSGLLYLSHPPTDESDMSGDETFFHTRPQHDDPDVGLTPDSRAEVEAYRQQVRAEGREYDDEDGHGDGDEYYDEQDSFSERSSAVFDPDNDPAGFAERLDELAGVMEIGEEEARALRWGPNLGGDDTPLCVDEFKDVLYHHIAATEWRYEMPQEKEHPIAVLGPAWAGRRILQEEETFSGYVG